MAKKQGKQITESAVTDAGFSPSDWPKVAEYVCDLWSDRKGDRKDREKQWKEIDRQIAMTPNTSHKLDAQGRPDTKKAWMPECELPLQAQTLEILTADARRMMFPDSGPWFAAHSLVTDEYLRRVDLKAMISGDENDVPSRITQDNVDKLVAGTIEHWHGQYDFAQTIDLVNAEAFKYGCGIGRGRVVTKKQVAYTARGAMADDQKFPVLVPRSIKNVYLDDEEQNVTHEGFMLGPSIIAEQEQSLADLWMAARAGGTDPDDRDGGWMLKYLKGLEGDDDGNICLIELEGDIVIARSQGTSLYVPSVIVTVVHGEAGGKPTQRVIRMRFRREPFSSYVLFPYHREHIDCEYGTSPLMKGRPVQVAAVEAMNKLFMNADLAVLPPVSFPSDDPAFALHGGPRIEPGAKWPTTGALQTHIIGNPQAMFSIYSGLLNQYYDGTGVNPPRLGAQTVSHTTAYSKQQELDRGQIRTVDYVRSSLKGALTKWLSMAYVMGRDVFRPQDIYIPSYGGYVRVTKTALPETAIFDVFGSGGPQEEAIKAQRRLQSVQLALQIKAAAAQQGQNVDLDLNAIVEQVLHEGGWTDIDALKPRPQPVAGTPDVAGLGGSAGLITAEPGAVLA